MAEFCNPASMEEALDLLATHSGAARVIAGGTDLLIDLRKGKKQAQFLVDITRIPGLGEIRIENGFVEIGAAVTFAAIKEDTYLKRAVPMLSEAASSVGAMGIQTTATWIGNLVQAMPAADGAIVALALEAEARITEHGKVGWRAVNILFAGPGKSTVDFTRQVITHLRFKIPVTAWGTAWQRVGRRSALVLPTLNCAVKLEMDQERIGRAVVALGPVASTPFQARETEVFLAGKLPTQEIFAEAGRIAQNESNPRGNVLRASRAYRLAIIPVVIRRALSIAARRAQGQNDQ